VKKAGKGLIIISIISVMMGLFESSALAAKKEIKVWLMSTYVWKTAVDRYNKMHPKVHVTLLSGDLDKFYTLITAGMMPDVWGPWDTPGITADVNRNWALDLGPYIKRDGKAIDIDDISPAL
jgi:ABC-type glycerol-3-phosphate transport system substrate-binding protein